MSRRRIIRPRPEVQPEPQPDQGGGGDAVQLFGVDIGKLVRFSVESSLSYEMRTIVSGPYAGLPGRVPIHRHILVCRFELPEGSTADRESLNRLLNRPVVLVDGEGLVEAGD